MDKGSYLLKAFLEKYNPLDSSSLIYHLDENLQKKLEGISEVSPSVFEFNFFQWVNEIHYSWLLTFIELLKPEEQILLKKGLSKKQKKGLEKTEAFDSTNYTGSLTIFFKSYLAKKICEQEKDLLPPNFLPSSPLKILLLLEKADLIKLISFLGIFDLAAEMKHIIDRTLIEKIRHSLTSNELKFLQYCSKTAIRWNPPKIDFAQWNGDAKTLHKLLHQRGLYRFAKALTNENSNLIWHITHRLDIGRGNAILKILKTPSDQSVTAHFQKQLLSIIRMVKNI